MPNPPTIDRTPLYAAAGAAEAVAETLRDLPGRISKVVGDDALRAEIRNRFNELPADAKAFRKGFPETLLHAPQRASELPDRARELAVKAGHEAEKTYRELAARGETAVERWRAEYGPAVQGAATTVRGRVADIADVTRRVVDDLGGKKGQGRAEG